MNADELDEETWREALGDSPARDFTVRVFRTKPAMVRKELEDGWRVSTEYDSAKFSDEEHELVQGGWDHEHCVVCWATIEDGDTYWENSQKLTLCPNCYAKFEIRVAPHQP